MPFVLKDADGLYLKGKNAWRMQMVSDINEARVYPTTGAARNSINQRGRYNRNRDTGLHVVEIEINLKEVS